MVGNHKMTRERERPGVGTNQPTMKHDVTEETKDRHVVGWDGQVKREIRAM